MNVYKVSICLLGQQCEYLCKCANDVSIINYVIYLRNNSTVSIMSILFNYVNKVSLN